MSQVLVLLAEQPHSGLAPLPGVSTDGAAWRSVFAQAGMDGDQVQVRPASGRPLEIVEPWARSLADRPGVRGLMILAGHGGADGALLSGPDGDLLAADLVRLLEAALPGRGITVVVDACPGALPASLRSCDLVLSASAPGVPAEEIQVEGRSYGALSWACQRVLERWMSTGPHGAIVPISAAVLARQAGMVLAGLGFAQVPVLVGPRDAAEQPLLGPDLQGRTLRTAPLEASVTRQISPGHDGFRVYNLTAGGNTTEMVVIGPGYQPPAGWTANREYWTALPVDGAVLKVKGTTPPGTVPSTVYPHYSFNPAGGTGSHTLTPSGSLQVFSLNADSAVVGYLTIGTGSPPALSWYMTMSPLDTYFPVPSAGLTFTKVTSAVTITAQKRP